MPILLLLGILSSCWKGYFVLRLSLHYRPMQRDQSWWLMDIIWPILILLRPGGLKFGSTKYLTDFSASVLMVTVTAAARTAPCTGPAATAPGSPGTRASAGGRGGSAPSCARPRPSAVNDPSVSQSVFAITEKAPIRAFSWLKAPTSAFTVKTLLRPLRNGNIHAGVFLKFYDIVLVLYTVACKCHCAPWACKSEHEPK